MKPGAIWARNVLTVGQRLEIFLEHGASRSLGYASRIEDMVDDELIVALPFDENGAPVIPHEGENIYYMRQEMAAIIDFSQCIINIAGIKDGFRCSISHCRNLRKNFKSAECSV